MSTETQGVFTSPGAFLHEIFERFLDTVDPRESGLLDHLRQTVIDSDVEQEIVAENSRRDKARKLWKHLRRVPPEHFRDYCYPILKDLYPHVLGETRYVYDASGGGDVMKCIRHVIMERIQLRRFADVLYATTRHSFEDYTKVTEGRTDDGKWDVLFELCARNKNNDNLISRFQGILWDIEVTVPNNLPDLLSEGVPCECKAVDHRQRRPRVSKSFRLTVDDSDDCKSDSASGSSSSSCFSSRNSSQESITVDNEDVREETQFDTKEQKDAFLWELENINSAINKASSIGNSYGRLAGVREELSIVMENAKSELTLDDCKIRSLQETAREIYHSLQLDFKEAEETGKRAKVTKLPFKLPAAKDKMLFKRRQMLLNDVEKAIPFYKQAEDLISSMSIPPENPIQDESVEEPGGATHGRRLC